MPYDFNTRVLGSSISLLDIRSRNSARKAIFEVLSHPPRMRNIGIIRELLFFNGQVMFQYEEWPHSYGTVWEGFQLSSLPTESVVFLIVLFVWVFYLWRIRWRRRGRGKFRSNFLLLSQENEPFLNENKIMVHDVSVPVFTHTAVISDNCTSLGEDIQESQELVLSPLVPHIESIIGLKLWVRLCKGNILNITQTNVCLSFPSPHTRLGTL